MGITCKQATDYISKREDGRLTVGQRVQLWRHLAACSLCRRYATFSRSVRQLFQLSVSATKHSVSDETKQRMVKRMFEENR